MRAIARFAGQPWHMKCLTSLLTAWCVGSLVGVVSVLLKAPAAMGLSLVDHCAFLAVPVLIGASVVLLVIGTRWVILLFALLSPAFWVAAVRLYPDQLTPVGRAIDWVYFSSFPLAFKYGMLFFLVCALYALFLQKWGHLT